MKPFVGYKENPLSHSDLLELINKVAIENTYYFLRWTHRVSGIHKLDKNSIDDQFQFPMLEGQIFNHEFELRWKHKQNNTYEVLLLSINEKIDVKIDVKIDLKIDLKIDHNFQPLDKEWQVEDRKAHFYPKTETRFPQSFDYPKNLPIKQRYFQDKTTATVHFVALTL